MDNPDQVATKFNNLVHERLERLLAAQDRLQKQLEQVTRRVSMLEASQGPLHRNGLVLAMVVDDVNGGWPEVSVTAQGASGSTSVEAATVVNLNTLVD